MEQVCKEKHIRIDECLVSHEKTLRRLGERMDKMDVFSNRLEERLDGLIKQIGKLNSLIMGFMGLIMGGIVTFFFYALQSGLLG